MPKESETVTAPEVKTRKPHRRRIKTRPGRSVQHKARLIDDDDYYCYDDCYSEIESDTEQELTESSLTVDSNNMHNADSTDPGPDSDQQTGTEMEKNTDPITHNVCGYYNRIQPGLGQIIVSPEATSLMQDVTHLELAQRYNDEPCPSTGMMTMMKTGPGITAFIEHDDYEHHDALDC